MICLKKTKASFFYFIIVVTLTLSCTEVYLPLTVNTIPISEVTYHSAASGVEWSGGGSGYRYIGVCLSKESNPTINDTVVTGGVSKYGNPSPQFISLVELAPNTRYHLRAFVKISDTVYGSEIEFTTLPFENTITFNSTLNYGLLSDIDGNLYKTIQIGSQVWMAENLKVTKYRDGSDIPYLDNSLWRNSTKGGYCLYGNGFYYDKTFGNLYNFYAVANERCLCPTGWHVPTIDEWKILTAYLGEGNSGKNLREIGILHWDSSNLNATNETGFTALPSGWRSDGFSGIGRFGTWWSSTTYNTSFVLVTSLNISSKDCFVGNEALYFNDGVSVRCLKDN